MLTVSDIKSVFVPVSRMPRASHEDIVTYREIIHEKWITPGGPFSKNPVLLDSPIYPFLQSMRPGKTEIFFPEEDHSWKYVGVVRVPTSIYTTMPPLFLFSKGLFDEQWFMPADEIDAPIGTFAVAFAA